ncbi:enhancer of split M1 protein-like [Teleopsis dalmanni]|uniref:enhancer of split M1 protein-like n=1 Tax=Teleopsis dalmanni TaxID=139649 RepID=UPI0018CE773C|nr:enhancer of split M1 protein-like [Teleopsis dalmanni]
MLLKFIIFLGCCICIAITADTQIKCERLCPDVNLPICAQCNGKPAQLKNFCELQNRKCHAERCYFLWSGPCERRRPEAVRGKREVAIEEVDNCNFACTMMYQPVCARCGKEYVTFGNSCAMQYRNCKTIECEIVSNGACAEIM